MCICREEASRGWPPPSHGLCLHMPLQGQRRDRVSPHTQPHTSSRSCLLGIRVRHLGAAAPLVEYAALDATVDPSLKEHIRYVLMQSMLGVPRLIIQIPLLNIAPDGVFSTYIRSTYIRGQKRYLDVRRFLR